MTDVGPSEGARHKSVEKCHWIFSNFSLGGIFSTTDGKNMTTINNFYVKKRPSCCKVGTPTPQGWGSWKPTSALAANSWLEKYRCSLVRDSLLCGLGLSSLQDVPISPSDINTTSQFSEGTFEGSHWVLLSDLWLTCWGDWEACERAKLLSWWLLSPVRHIVSTW